MILETKKWYDAIKIRRSRRTYLAKTIEAEIVAILKENMKRLNELHPGVRLAYVDKSPTTLIEKSVGPYGKITGAPAFFLVVANTKINYFYEKAGYIGQGIILEAATHGLSTCWIGGAFEKPAVPENIHLNEAEAVIAIIPVGYARKNLSLTEKMMNQLADYHKRKPLEQLVDGQPMEVWPDWLDAAIRAANLAPSAYNRQPLRYFIGEDYSITISIENYEEETNVSKELDRGIAMLHMDLAFHQFNINGSWSYIPEKAQVKFKEEK